MEIKAAVVHAPRTPFIIEAVRLEAPRADEVLVKLTATGVCHTDVATSSDMKEPGWSSRSGRP